MDPSASSTAPSRRHGQYPAATKPASSFIASPPPSLPAPYAAALPLLLRLFVSYVRMSHQVVRTGGREERGTRYCR